MDKTSLRQTFLTARRTLPSPEMERLSDAVAARLQADIDWRALRTVHVYRARPGVGEVATAWLEKFLQAEWPHISLTYGQTSADAPLPTGKYDLVIVPVVAFDADRNRLGFGGGWYDRFLATQPDALKIGLAFELQRAAVLPVEPHDVRLDRIVTERRVFEAS